MKSKIIISAVLLSTFCLLLSTPLYAQATSVIEKSSVNLSLTPEKLTVGTTVNFNMTFKDPDTGVLYDRAQIAVKIFNADLNQPVFSTSFYSLNGNVVFDYGFTEEGNYKLILDASPTEFSVQQFQAFTKELPLTVLKAPISIWIYIKFLFALVLMFIFGVFASRQIFRRKKQA